MSNESLSKHLKDAFEEIAKEQGFKDYKILSKAQEFTGDHYSGDITRVEIKPSEGTSLHLIVKTASGDPLFRKMMPLVKYYKTETYFYTDVFPAMEKVLKVNEIPSCDILKVPKMFKSLSEEFKEAIIMKDMGYEGYVIQDKMKPFSQEQTKTIIKNLAQLHAASFIMKEKDPELYIELCKNIPLANNNIGDMSIYTPSFLGYTSHIECPVKRAKVNKFGEVMVDKLIEVLDSKCTEPYNVICHGDCWNNNMLFKYEEEKLVDISLIDWQIAMIASPATDLSYLMFMSMDAEYVETNMEHLLDLYYLTLQEHLSIMSMDIARCYPREIFNKHIKRSLIYGFIMSMCTIPFILSNSKDAQKFEDIASDVKNGEVFSVPLNDFAKKRYNNVINYAVNHKLI